MDVSKALILYLISIFGFSISRGMYDLRLFFIILINFFLIFAAFYFKRGSSFINLDSLSVVPIVFVINNLLFVILFGGIYQSGGFIVALINFLLVLTILISSIYLFRFGKLNSKIYYRSFLLLVSLGIILKILLLISSPSPRIDVYDMLKYGPQNLLAGKNPYSEIYPKRYPGVEPNYYSYFPISLFLFIPAVVIFGDPRVTYIFSDLLVVFLLFKMLGKYREEYVCLKYCLPLLYLYHPSGSFILEQAWVEPLIFAFFVLFVYLEMFKSKASKFSFIPLGIFLGFKQSFIILIPFFWKFQKLRKSRLLLSLLFIMIFTIPFIFWSIKDFYDDTIKLLIDFPARYDSLVLNSFIYRAFHINFSGIISYFIWTIVFAFLILQKFDSWSRFVLILTSFLYAFYIFNKLAFVHYYFFISVLILLYSIVSLVESASSKV